MRRAALAVVCAAVLASRSATRSDDLDAFLPRLTSAVAAERAAAASELAQAVTPERLDAALDAVRQWPPAAALRLRALLRDLPRLRAPLLERCGDASRGELARALLVAAFHARAEATAPFRADRESSDERRLPWNDGGLRVARRGARGERLAWRDVEHVLVESRAFDQPVARWPGALAEGVVAPWPRVVPAAGWLEVELARAGLVPTRLVVATWIVPREVALVADEPPQEASRRLAARLELEGQWLDRALVALARAGPFERGRDGAELLAAVGLPCLASSGGDAEFARGVAAALATRSGEDAAATAASTVAAVTRDDPPTPTETWTRQVESCCDRAAADDVAATRARLREALDALADRFDDEPLLAGRLADRLRARAATLDDAAPQRAVLEESVRELWLLGRAARPATRLVELPRGVAPR